MCVLALLVALTPTRALGQNPGDTLGTTALTFGNGATSSSVLLRASSSWTAQASASWLHVAAGSSSGSGNATVLFSLDAMSDNGSRVGALTIDGMALTITQAGADYTASGTSVPGASLAMAPIAIAVDSAGNQYIAGNIYTYSCLNGDPTTCRQPIASDGVLQRVDAVTKAVTTLGSGIRGVGGVAVDSARNVYVVDVGNNAIREWTASTGLFTTIASGLSNPQGVAVDGAGAVYFCDNGNGALKKWTAASQQTTSLYQIGYCAAVAVDILGNVYFTDAEFAPIPAELGTGTGGGVRKIDATTLQVTQLFSVKNPGAINVDGSGNVYFMDAVTFEPYSDFLHYNPSVWNVATGQVTSLQNTFAFAANTILPLDHGIAVDSLGNVYIGAHDYNQEYILPYAQVPSGTITEPITAGTDTLPAVLPATVDLTAIAPQSDQAWLSLGSAANDAVPFSFSANNTGAPRTAHISILGVQSTITQGITTVPNVLGLSQASATSALDNAYFTVATPVTVAYSTTVTAGNVMSSSPVAGTQVMVGSSVSLVVSGGPAGLGSSSWQVGSGGGSSSVGLSAVVPWTASSNNSDWLHLAAGSASGTGNAAIGFTVDPLTTTGMRTGTLTIAGLTFTVTQYGIDYIHTAQGWVKGDYVPDVTGQTQANAGATLSSAGLTAGSISYGLSNSVPVGSVISSSPVAGTLLLPGSAVNLVLSTTPIAVPNLLGMQQTAAEAAIRAAGLSVGPYTYYGSYTVPYGGATSESPSAGVAVAQGAAVSMVYSNGFSMPNYVGQTQAAATTAIQSLSMVVGQVTYAVNATVPAGTVVSTTPAANARAGVGTVVNMVISQGAAVLSANSLPVSSAGTTSSVYLTVPSSAAVWTAGTSDSFLHISPASLSGTGDGWIDFTVDAYSGTGVRTGTLTINGQTFTVTQVGTDYSATGELGSAISSGLNGSNGVAVDGRGNVYIADTGNSAVKKWNSATQQTTTLVPSTAGISGPNAVAVDRAGNVYIGDNGGALWKWTAATAQLSMLVYSAAFDGISGVALDAAGNVYIAAGTSSSKPSTIQKWTASTQQLSVLVTNTTGTFFRGLALDSSGNVYFSTNSPSTGALSVWNAPTQQVTSLGTGFNGAWGVAVDPNGNVYFAEVRSSTIRMWSPVTQQITPVYVDPVQTSNLYRGVAVDASGNLYFTHSAATSISEFMKSYAPSGSIAEPNTAGSGTMPSLIPLTTNLTGTSAPTSDQPWLTIGTVSNGVVQFAFDANTAGTPRTGHITVLGIQFTVTQGSQQVAVPDVTGQAQAAAASAITGAGLVLGNVTSASSSTVASGNVISTNPVAGTQVASGSAVDMAVSTGPAQSSTSILVASGSATYGDAQGILGADLKAGANPVPNQSLAFSIDGAIAGSGTTDSNGHASLSAPLAGLAAGPHTISVSFAGVSSYSASKSTALLTIAKASATVTPNAASKTYGTADPALTGTLTGFLASDAITVTYSRATGESVAGGPYTISGTLGPAAALANYTIVYNTASFTINKATATVTPNSGSKTYGAADPVLSGTLIGFVPSDSVVATYSRTGGESVAGGPYTISGGLSPAAALANYTITYNTASFNITKAAATVAPNAASKAYGASDPVLTGTLTGFLASDAITATYSRVSGESVAGGPYGISGTLSSAAALANYNITYNTASFTISKAMATVTPNPASKPYGSADPALTGTTTGFLPGDGVTASYSRNAGESVAGGPYTITGVLSPAAALANYTITYNTASFTIGKATATVTPNAASKIYGAADPVLSGTLSGFLPSDGITATYSRAVGESVTGGPYTIAGTLSPASASANYNVTYNTAPFTITAASQTIQLTGVPTAATFGQGPFAVSAKASSSLPVQLTASGNCVLTSNSLSIGTTGNCTVTATQPGNSNYGAAPAVSSTFAISAAATTLVVGVPSGTVQYSDTTSFTATLTPASAGGQSATGSVQFYLNGIATGAPVPVNSAGLANLTGVRDQLPAGNYPVSAVFSSSNSSFKGSSSTNAVLSVAQENAFLLYTGDTVAQLGSTLNLRATVWDSAAAGYAGPNPEPGTSATVGDVTKIWVAFDVYPAGTCGSGTPATYYAQAGSSATPGVATAALGITSATEVSDCVITRLVAAGGGINTFYSALNTEAAGVDFYVNSGQFATGGGWVTDPLGTHGNFGFNARYNSNGAAKGQLVYIYRGTYNGVAADFIVKSNALTALRFTSGTFPITSTLQGKASLQINRSSDGYVLLSAGNYTFNATVTDSGQSGISGKQFSLTVYDSTGVLYHSVPSGTALQGGNVVVHQR